MKNQIKKPFFDFLDPNFIIRIQWFKFENEEPLPILLMFCSRVDCLIKSLHFIQFMNNNIFSEIMMLIRNLIDYVIDLMQTGSLRNFSWLNHTFLLEMWTLYWTLYSFTKNQKYREPFSPTKFLTPISKDEKLHFHFSKGTHAKFFALFTSDNILIG